MRDFQDKLDNAAPSSSGILSAAEDNVRFAELKNMVSSAGIGLDPAFGPDTQLNMMAQAAARYASGGVFGTDTGAANALVVGGSGSFVMPKAYFTSMRVHCRANAGNTGAATCNAFALGAKAVLDHLGNALQGGEWIAGQPIELVYDAALASGVGAFRLMPWTNIRRRGGLPFGVQIFGSSGTWTKPTGLSYVYVKAIGGGGSGGSRTDGIYGGGGGAGGHFEGWWPASALGATESVTVGAGGASVAANSATNGNAGGATTFKGVSAGGGGGGNTNTAGGAGGVFDAGSYGLVLGCTGLAAVGSLDSGMFHTPSTWGLFGIGGRGGKTDLASQAGGQGVLYIVEF